MGGIGAGLAYIVPIATCIKWFPERKRLIAGIAVAGFAVSESKETYLIQKRLEMAVSYKSFLYKQAFMA